MTDTDFITEITSGETEEAWPESDVLVLPGVPGWGDESWGGSLQAPFPDTVTDTVKRLRQAGLGVEHVISRHDRQQVSLNSADIWFPVLLFGQDVLSNISADVVVDIMKALIGGRISSSPKLHVKQGIRRANGETEFLETHGPADKVLEAQRNFLESRMRDHGP